MTLIFCLGALFFLLVGGRLILKASPFKGKGGYEFAARWKRKTLGQILVTEAGLLLIVALFYKIYESRMEMDANLEGNASRFGNIDPIALPEGVFSTPKPKVSSTNDVVAPRDPAAEAAQQKQRDDEIARADEEIKKAPSNFLNYELRGNIFGREKKWDLAKKDYKRALEIAPGDSTAIFNLAEIDFLQKDYAASREGFVALEKDPELKDVAAYRVFVCDLVGGHEDVAAKELDAFNQVGSNASYYFANLAWALNHKKQDEADNWLATAVKIYPLEKVRLYAHTLVDLGYLPPPADR